MGIEQRIDQNYKKRGSRRWLLKGAIAVLGGLAGGEFVLSAKYGLEAKNEIGKKREAETELVRTEYQQRNARLKAEITPTPADPQKTSELREEIKNSSENIENLTIAHNQSLESGIALGGLDIILVMFNESAEDSIR